MSLNSVFQDRSLGSWLAKVLSLAVTCHSAFLNALFCIRSYSLLCPGLYNPVRSDLIPHGACWACRGQLSRPKLIWHSVDSQEIREFSWACQMQIRNSTASTTWTDMRKFDADDALDIQRGRSVGHAYSIHISGHDQFYNRQGSSTV